MSKSATLDLSMGVRQGRMDKVKAYLAIGGMPWPPYTEEYENNMSMAETKRNWDSADGNVDREDTSTRLQANFAGALYRDAFYAHAGRNYLLKLAHHNAFRELYEGGKIGIDNTLTWREGE
jgi:hypothetical protein